MDDDTRQILAETLELLRDMTVMAEMNDTEGVRYYNARNLELRIRIRDKIDQ